MEARRQSDVGLGNRFLRESRRYVSTIVILLIMIGLTFLLPNTKDEALNQSARQGILALLITVSLKTVMGVSVAHLLRKGFFQFLDMEKLIADHHWEAITFLTVWYAVFIYAFAIGG